MIESKNDASRNLEKALQALEQAKQRAWTPAEGVVCLAAAKRGKGQQAALATLLAECRCCVWLMSRNRQAHVSP